MTIDFSNTWRPLPSCVTIKESTIDGLGAFATDDISEGTNLGLMRIFYHGEWIRTALGAFINHSENPSCKNILHNSELKDPEYYLITSKDIKAGEELTLSYQMPEYHQTTS
tara:strand:+ start:1599 stop:1931 length:333 start_codon:yes stop_codon:yes gene_type:complete